MIKTLSAVTAILGEQCSFQVMKYVEYHTGGIQVLRGAFNLILKVVLPSHPPNSPFSLTFRKKQLNCSAVCITYPSKQEVSLIVA